VNHTLDYRQIQGVDKTPVDIAVEMGFIEIEDLLREYGENPGRPKKKPVP